MIVDDSSIMWRRIERSQQFEVFEVVGTAAVGVEAVALLKRTDPDLVTIDTTIPHMDGIECIAQLVCAQLRTCCYPEIPVNIVDLGLVYDCAITGKKDGGRDVAVRMTLTAPGCGIGELLVTDVRDKLLMIPTVRRADVELVFESPWNQLIMAESTRLRTRLM